MRRLVHLAIAITACGAPLVAQSTAPEISYDANADLLKFPENIHLGEAAGVATNSKGQIFVYTRTGASHATLGTSRTFYKSGSRLLQFDPVVVRLLADHEPFRRFIERLDRCAAEHVDTPRKGLRNRRPCDQHCTRH